MNIDTRPLPSKADARALVEACIASIAARKAAHEDYIKALSGGNADKVAAALAAFEASVAAAVAAFDALEAA